MADNPDTAAADAAESAPESAPAVDAAAVGAAEEAVAFFHHSHLHDQIDALLAELEAEAQKGWDFSSQQFANLGKIRTIRDLIDRIQPVLHSIELDERLAADKMSRKSA